MRHPIQALALALLLATGVATAAAAELGVSGDGHHLLRDGRPFFYLGDTAWCLFLGLDREQADEYLKKRAKQGFNVVMAILIGEQPHKDEKNAYGEPPLLGKDPARPNEKYFEHVDWIVKRANSLGMVVAIAPAWCSWLYKNVPPGPHPFDTKNARSFGEYVGRRYRNDDVVWVIGGDRSPAGFEPILRAMVAGLDEGDGTRDFLMTFHGVKIGKPLSPGSVYIERLASADLFGDEPWLDFHGAYSGHQWGYPIHRHIAAQRAMKPVRPVIDLEPCYENHPYHADGSRIWGSSKKWDGKTRGTAALVRMQAYRALFAGAAGHTYGANDVWAFHDDARPLADPRYQTNTHWRTALDFPGAAQMGFMRRLFESRPWQTLEPDQKVMVSDPGEAEEHRQASRARGGKFVFVYLPRGGSVTIDMTKLSGREAIGHWFDPRTGESRQIGTFPCSGTRQLEAPSHGPDNDWVLVLDDASESVARPGSR